MSQRKVTTALLEGFNPPVFPVMLNTIRLALEKTRLSHGPLMTRIAKRLPGYMERAGERMHTTSDDYFWYWNGFFKTPSGVVAIYTPYYQDWKGKNGTQADRYSAVYTQGPVTKSEIAAVLQQYHDAIFAFAEDRRIGKEKD